MQPSGQPSAQPAAARVTRPAPAGDDDLDIPDFLK
jgi:hypothetical protein